MIETLRRDIQSVFDRDPAARSVPEVVLCYPGLHALWGYRLSHWLWTHDQKLLGRMVSQTMRWITGIEIHPGATIGKGFFIDHGMGVVVGETAEIGDDVTLYHGVTLGGTSLAKGKRHPTIGNRVTVGAGAKILGAITIGDDSRVGANAVVVKPAPANSVIVGVPGQNIARSTPHTMADKPDLEHTKLPDLVGVTLQSLMTRVSELEQHVEGHVNGNGSVHPPTAGVWQGQDFAI